MRGLVTRSRCPELRQCRRRQDHLREGRRRSSRKDRQVVIRSAPHAALACGLGRTLGMRDRIPGFLVGAAAGSLGDRFRATRLVALLLPVRGYRLRKSHRNRPYPENDRQNGQAELPHPKHFFNYSTLNSGIIVRVGPVIEGRQRCHAAFLTPPRSPCGEDLPHGHDEA